MEKTMTKKTVLIVEDHPDLRKLIKMTLSFGPYEVHEADNGESAVHMAGTLRPDLVFMDVMMPGLIDGYQACSRIKSNPQLPHVRVVMLTARGQETDLEMGKLAGADAYITKPFSPLELIDVAERQLKAVREPVGGACHVGF
jgi:CheY-like chemotaxis protein